MESGVAGAEPSSRRLRRDYERFGKPAADFVLGVALSVLTFPLVVILAAAIRFTMGRPVLFTQLRVGLHGKPFTVYKFRTMEPDRRIAQREFAGSDRRVVHKSSSDPRHTALGRFLRKWSLDEIPQVWNVAKGDMSLVGPRPELVEVVAAYEPWQHRRHVVKPGVTGLWQVSQRGDVPMHEATELDLEYVDRLSLRTDVEILIQTIPALLRRRGA